MWWVRLTDADRGWGVWRRHDQRGRMIGTLTSTQVEMLRLNRSLAVLPGEAERTKLVWIGTHGHDDLDEPVASSSALFEEDETRARPRRSLLEVILSDRRERHEQKRLAQAALDYSEDLRRASTDGQLRGMNWSMLALGGRVQGGRPNQRVGQVANASEAVRRLTQLEKVLGEAQTAPLYRLIIAGESKTSLSRHYGWTPSLAYRRALKALRDLAKAYYEDINLPHQAIVLSS